MKTFLIFILVFSFLNAIPKTLDKEKILRKVTSEDLGEIDINVIYTNRIYMTSEGNFFFMTNYNDTEANIFDASDIEEYTFSTKITASETYSYDSYDVNCRLWKPLKENLRVFCQVVNYYSSKKMVSCSLLQWLLCKYSSSTSRNLSKKFYFNFSIYTIYLFSETIY